MNYKLEYITRLLQKTSGKKIEHYVISRIWHLLNNFDVKVVPQQYVSKTLFEYALTDLYFPQLGIHVEVNEPAHYKHEDRIIRDLERKNEIEKMTGHQVLEIDCRKDLIGIHAQVDDIISKINFEIEQQILNGKFKSWNPDNEHNPNYWKSKGLINVSDEVSLRTIEDICLLFDADFRKTLRGFLRKGGIPHPKNTNQLIWWPSEHSRSGWLNHFDEGEQCITETHADLKKKSEHYHSHINGEYFRIVFYHYKDVLGLTTYKFVGVFTNDRIRSCPDIGTIWKRVGNQLNLDTNNYAEV